MARPFSLSLSLHLSISSFLRHLLVRALYRLSFFFVFIGFHISLLLLTFLPSLLVLLLLYFFYQINRPTSTGTCVRCYFHNRGGLSTRSIFLSRALFLRFVFLYVTRVFIFMLGGRDVAQVAADRLTPTLCGSKRLFNFLPPSPLYFIFFFLFLPFTHGRLYYFVVYYIRASSFAPPSAAHLNCFIKREAATSPSVSLIFNGIPGSSQLLILFSSEIDKKTNIFRNKFFMYLEV